MHPTTSPMKSGFCLNLSVINKQMVGDTKEGGEITRTIVNQYERAQVTLSLL